MSLMDKMGCGKLLETYRSNPRTLVHHVWVVSLAFALADIVTSFAVASSNDAISHGSKGAGFAAIWSMLMVIAISIYSYFALYRWRSAFSVGYLIGALLMMSQMFLCLFAVFVGLSQAAENRSYRKRLSSDNGAMAAFCFFLFVIYAVLGGLVARHRSHIIVEAPEKGGDIDDFQNPAAENAFANPDSSFSSTADGYSSDVVFSTKGADLHGNFPPPTPAGNENAL